MRARVAAAFATLDLSALPNYCIGFDIGGEREDINTDRTRLMVLASKHGGLDCAVFDTSYFRTLRFEANYWYCFAGYFTRSRWPAVVWGAATVV